MNDRTGKRLKIKEKQNNEQQMAGEQDRVDQFLVL